MDFSRHITNTIEWFYFEDVTSGRERDASVLVLGDKETTAPFVTLLEPRVHQVSRRLDDSTYDYVVIPVLTKKILRLFQGDVHTMLHATAGRISFIFAGLSSSPFARPFARSSRTRGRPSTI